MASETTMPQGPHAPLTPRDRWLRHWRLLLIAATTIIIAIACRDMHFNPDSVHYFDVARVMLEEHTVATYHLTLASERVPSTNLYWPPLYPALLAVPLAFGASPEVASALIAVLSYGACIAALAWMVRTPHWAVAAALAFLYLSFISGLPFRATSEGPYAALMLWSIVCAGMAAAAQSDRRSFWLGIAAGALAGASMLMRHVGLATIAATVAAVILAPGIPRERRWDLVIAIAGGAAFVVIPWLAREVLVNGDLLGRDRPAGGRSFDSNLMRLAASTYLFLGPLLLAMTIAALGYRRRRDASLTEPATSVFVTAALASAVLQIAVVIVSQTLYVIDEPPDKRYFFPGFVSVLAFGLALARTCEPPREALRRWPLIALLALPIALGPIGAVHFSTDVTPRRTAMDRWVERNTEPDALIIAWRGWPFRFYTGRPVLEAGQVADPPLHDGERVRRFLEEFGDRFPEVYLVVQSDQMQRAVANYRAAGLTVERVDTIRSAVHDYDGPKDVDVEFYRVELPR